MGTRKEHSRILVVSCGEVTEVEYLKYVKSKLRASGIDVVVVSDNRAPSALVAKAVDLRDKERLDARRSRDSSNVLDAVWVVVDVDEFEKDLSDAMIVAQGEKIEVAVSNPCFEVWLVLHKSDQTAHVSSAEIQKRAASLGMVALRHEAGVRVPGVAVGG